MIIWGLEKMGATVQARGMMYKAVAQSVRLYGSEIWLVTGSMLKFLERVHHRAARQITGMMAKFVADVGLEFTPVVVVLESAVLHPIHDYIRRWQATIASQVA